MMHVIDKDHKVIQQECDRVLPFTLCWPGYRITNIWKQLGHHQSRADVIAAFRKRWYWRADKARIITVLLVFGLRRF